MANLNIKQLFTNILTKLKGHDTDISNLNSKITLSGDSTATVASGVTSHFYRVYKFGRILIFSMMFSITSAKDNDGVIFSGIPNTYKPNGLYMGIVNKSGGTGYIVTVNDNGTIAAASTGVPAGNWYQGFIIAIANN